jgi:hypothetical protein
VFRGLFPSLYVFSVNRGRLARNPASLLSSEMARAGLSPSACDAWWVEWLLHANSPLVQIQAAHDVTSRGYPALVVQIRPKALKTVEGRGARNRQTVQAAHQTGLSLASDRADTDPRAFPIASPVVQQRAGEPKAFA